jgi:hypothetical protein
MGTQAVAGRLRGVAEQLPAVWSSPGPAFPPRQPARELPERESGDGAPLTWRGPGRPRAGPGHHDHLGGGRLDGEAGTDGVGSGAQGLLPAGIADGQVRDHLGVLAAVRRAGRKRGEGRAGQGAERRGLARTEPDDLRTEPADPVQGEPEREASGPG